MKFLQILFLLVLLFIGCKPKEVNLEPLENVAFIVSSGSKTVDVIDLESQSIISSYSVTSDKGRFPHHIYLSNDGKKLAIANPAYDFSNGHSGLHGVQISGGVIVLNSQTGKKLHDFDVPHANHNVVFSPDDSEVWTTGLSHSGKAYVYNANSPKLIKEIQLDADPSEIFFTPNGKYAVVRSGEGSFLQFVDTNVKEMVKGVKIDLSEGNVWPGYGNVVLVSNSTRKSVNFVDVSTFSVTDFIDFDFVPGYVCFNELTKELWVCSSKENKLKILKKLNGIWEETTVLDFSEADPHMVKFYNSGQNAILINQKENTAVFINTTTKQILKTISIGEKPNGIAIL